MKSFQKPLIFHVWVTENRCIQYEEICEKLSTENPFMWPLETLGNSLMTAVVAFSKIDTIAKFFLKRYFKKMFKYLRK